MMLMVNLFARKTSLHDVAGRIDYISNPLRQENLLAFYDTASDLLDGKYWEVLAKESRDAYQKYSAKKEPQINWDTWKIRK